MSPELEHIRREVERLTCDKSPAAWREAPPGKWSCAEVMEHLLLCYTGTTRGVLRTMDVGRPLGGKPTLRDKLRTIWVTKLGLLSPGRTSPPNILPKNGLDMDSMRRFYDALVAMDATLTDAERRFGSSAKLLDHPSIGPLNAQEWRRFHLAHTRLHLRQMASRS